MKVLHVTAGEYARLQSLSLSTAPILEHRLVPVSSLLAISRALDVPARDLHADALLLQVHRDVIVIRDRLTEWGR